MRDWEVWLELQDTNGWRYWTLTVEHTANAVEAINSAIRFYESEYPRLLSARVYVDAAAAKVTMKRRSAPRYEIAPTP